MPWHMLLKHNTGKRKRAVVDFSSDVCREEMCTLSMCLVLINRLHLYSKFIQSTLNWQLSFTGWLPWKEATSSSASARRLLLSPEPMSPPYSVFNCDYIQNSKCNTGAPQIQTNTNGAAGLTTGFPVFKGGEQAWTSEPHLNQLIVQLPQSSICMLQHATHCILCTFCPLVDPHSNASVTNLMEKKMMWGNAYLLSYKGQSKKWQCATVHSLNLWDNVLAPPYGIYG